MSKYDEDEITWSDDEKIFDSPTARRDGAASSSSRPNANGKTAQHDAQSKTQQQRPPISHLDAEEAREAALQQELENVRKINTVIEGVVESLEKAKGNMDVCFPRILPPHDLERYMC